MDKPKGGRGHSAPYETKQMRVPTGLEPQIQELISRFRQWISDAAPGGLGVNSPPKLLDKPVDKLAQDQLDSVRSQLKDCREDGERLAYENGRFLAAQQKAEAAVEELRSRIAATQAELADQAERAKAAQAETEGLRSQLKAAQAELEELRSRSQSDAPEVIALLQDAITPIKKGGSYAANNATGIKRLVEKALELLS